MEFRKRILVFPCGSEIGLEIHNALQYSRHLELYGGSSVDDHGKFVYKNYIGNIPFVYSKDFIGCLNKIVIKHKIDLIYPAHDDVLYYLSKEKNKLECDVIAPDVKTAEICRFKSKTYSFFNKLLPVPFFYKNINEIKKYPVFLKPDAGQGTRGTFRALNKEEAKFYLKKDKALLILEYLPGEEYTVDCFTNRHGKLLFVGPRVRNRIQNGISVNTRPLKHINLFLKYAGIINNNLKLRGAWFFQVKSDKKGVLKLMEIANRIAGSMALFRNIGVNFELLTIFDYYNIDVDIITNTYNIELDRALANKFKINVEYENVYVDFDDCLLKDNSINLKLVTFLYQCINNGKAIYLITRHRQNIYSTLKKYKLSKLFDKIYSIGQDKYKSSVIKKEKAIFIDDSFKERSEVYRNKKIPVFSPDTIECLLD